MCATEAHGRVMADGIEVSLVTLNIMESKTLKTHANACISRGRPTLKDVEHFRKGSVREIYERSIYERTFTSEPDDVNCRLQVAGCRSLVAGCRLQVTGCRSGFHLNVEGVG